LLSLALHVLLAALVFGTSWPKPREREPAIAMRLLSLSAPETAEMPSERAATPARPPAAVPSSAAASPPSAPERRSGAASPPDETAERPPGPRPGIAARLIDQIGERAPARTAEGVPTAPWSSPGDPVPGLPGRRGWLSGYVGRVTPSAHRWRANDGSGRARYVLADGTAVCTQRRAPTIDEIMNPWKSTAVTLASLCGRERPAPPDLGDPRALPPPDG
jgi:hypothetical protein